MKTPYKRSFSFSGFQANQPAKSLPGPRIDIEFDAIADRISGPVSAYDLAVANGFVGTEADFLASLVGPAGSELTAQELTQPGNPVGDAIVAATSFKDVARPNFPVPYLTRARQWAFITENDQVTGNGTSDDTAGVANAITKFVEQGREILVPDNCKIRLTSPLNLKSVKPVRIRGKSASNMAQGNTFPSLGPLRNTGLGSFFVHDHLGPMMTFGGISDTFTAGIGDVVLENLVVMQNQPAYTQTGTFTPLDSDFTFVFDSAHWRMENVDFLNVSRGILVKNQSGFASARSIRGQPLRVGIDVRNAYNPQNFYDIAWWFYWSTDAPVRTWMENNAVAFRSGRHDNPNWDAMFAIGYNKGLEFYAYDGVDGGGTGGTNRFNSTRFDLDSTKTSMYVHPAVTNLVASFGVLAGFKSAANTGPADANFQFSGNGQVYIGMFDPGPSRGPALLVDGSNMEVVISAFKEDRWDLVGASTPAFQTTQDGSSIRVGERMASRNGMGSVYATGHVTAPLTRKTFTLTTGSTFGDISVAHGGGVTPGYARVSVLAVAGAQNTQGVRGYAESFDGTNANLVFLNAAGARLNSTSVKFSLSTGFEQ